MAEPWPVISLVGVPNTGKSTLFNRLLGQRKALVHHDPGMTRDVYRQPCELRGGWYHLQDTGGFFPDDEIITKEVNRKVLQVAETSDLVVFLFDGRRDMLPYEQELWLEVRRRASRLLTVVNKIEQPDRQVPDAGVFALKPDPLLLVSAEHGTNMEDLEDLIARMLPGGQAREEEQPVRVSLVGKPNVGKSSLINRILGDDAAIVSPIPGTTRDSVDFEVRRHQKRYILVDNAGIRKWQKVREDTESAAVVRATRDMARADVVILVIDISHRPDQGDLFIARQVLETAKPVIVALNKWDLVSSDEQAWARVEAVKRQLNRFTFAPFQVVSAQQGRHVYDLLDRASAIHQSLQQKIPKSRLVSLLKELCRERRMVTRDGKPFNLRFAHVETYRPLFINLHARSEERLRPSDEQFLKKRLAEELGLEGIPLFIKVSLAAGGREPRPAKPHGPRRNR